jgi:hypothetical protein
MSQSNSSSRTTGNDPVEGLDPGGTRPTRPGNPDKTGNGSGENATVEQHVESGDRNGKHKSTPFGATDPNE